MVPIRRVMDSTYGGCGSRGACVVVAAVCGFDFSGDALTPLLNARCGICASLSSAFCTNWLKWFVSTLDLATWSLASSASKPSTKSVVVSASAGVMVLEESTVVAEGLTESENLRLNSGLGVRGCSVATKEINFWWVMSQKRSSNFFTFPLDYHDSYFIFTTCSSITWVLHMTNICS